MTTKRLIIILLAFLPSLFSANAKDTELQEMRLVSDSLTSAIQSNVRCDGQKKYAEIIFGDKGFNAGLLFATVRVCYKSCGFNPSKFIGFFNIGDYLIFVDRSCSDYMDWFEYLPSKRTFSEEQPDMRDGSSYWNFILFDKCDIILQSTSKGW